MTVTMEHPSTMQIKMIKQLAIKIFKTVNNLNPILWKIYLQVKKMLEYVLTIYLSEVTTQQHTVIKV